LPDDEIGKITDAIREDMKQRRKLDRGLVAERYVPMQWTEAHRKYLVNYKSGQVLRFHRSSRGIEKHEEPLESRSRRRRGRGVVLVRKAQGRSTHPWAFFSLRTDLKHHFPHQVERFGISVSLPPIMKGIREPCGVFRD
jgi:hypothetical protein